MFTAVGRRQVRAAGCGLRATGYGLPVLHTTSPHDPVVCSVCSLKSVVLRFLMATGYGLQATGFIYVVAARSCGL